MADEYLIDWARQLGARPGRAFRVMADIEGTINHRDFASLDEAVRYADDVASEGDHPHAVALVLDGELSVVHRGRHYAVALRSCPTR